MAGAPANVRALLAAASLRLDGDAARSEVELLLAHALGTSRSWLYAWPEHVPTPAQQARFAELVEARVRGEPVAYLLGEREFYGRRFGVSPAVLIPRPETELIVDLVKARIAPEAAPAILDLGTGSGALAVTLALEIPAARVTAVDLSPTALAVARANAAALGAQVSFVESDWFAAVGAARFDFIVSNPPYIADDDPHLAEGDVRFEPRTALASGRSGLDDLTRIAAAAPAFLAPGGWLLMEHGYDQAAAVRVLLQAEGFVAVASARDLAGIERVTLGRYPLRGVDAGARQA